MSHSMDKLHSALNKQRDFLKKLYTLTGFDDFYKEDQTTIDNFDGESLILRTVIVPDDNT